MKQNKYELVLGIHPRHLLGVLKVRVSLQQLYLDTENINFLSQTFKIFLNNGNRIEFQVDIEESTGIRNVNVLPIRCGGKLLTNEKLPAVALNTTNSKAQISFNPDIND